MQYDKAYYVPRRNSAAFGDDDKRRRQNKRVAHCLFWELW